MHDLTHSRLIRRGAPGRPGEHVTAGQGAAGGPFCPGGRGPGAGTNPGSHRARNMDPVQGRFLQRDSRAFADGMNVYDYANNNPINRTDASGQTVEREYSRPAGRLLDNHETALIKIKLVVDTSACKGETPDNCKGDVKVSMEYTSQVTVKPDKTAEGYAKEAVNRKIGIEYDKRFYPFKADKATNLTELAGNSLPLGVIPCKGGAKKYNPVVKSQKPEQVQHEIVLAVEIKCCGIIEVESIVATNKMGGTAPGEQNVQKLKDVKTEGRYPGKKQ